jgi:transposase
LKAAHRLREVLTLLFDTPLTQAQARDYLKGWASLVKASGLTCFDSFLTTLEGRLEEITNYFLDRQNSGFVEGLNSKESTRRAGGFVFTPKRGSVCLAPRGGKAGVAPALTD